VLQLFNVWVEPLVEVVVHLSNNKDAVVIEVCAITWETKSASAHLVAMSNLACSKAWHKRGMGSCTVWHFSQHRTKHTQHVQRSLIAKVVLSGDWSVTLIATVQAKNCRLSGSPLIENLHLDQRFCLSFVTTLTWSSAETSGQNGNEANSLQLPEQYGKGHIQVSSLQMDAQDRLLCNDSM